MEHHIHHFFKSVFLKKEENYWKHHLSAETWYKKRLKVILILWNSKKIGISCFLEEKNFKCELKCDADWNSHSHQCELPKILALHANSHSHRITSPVTTRLEFKYFKRHPKLVIFKRIFWLNGSFFSRVDWDNLKEEVKTYLMAQSLPLIPWQFFPHLHIYSVWFKKVKNGYLACAEKKNLPLPSSNLHSKTDLL